MYVLPSTLQGRTSVVRLSAETKAKLLSILCVPSRCCCVLNLTVKMKRKHSTDQNKQMSSLPVVRAISSDGLECARGRPTWNGRDGRGPKGKSCPKCEDRNPHPPHAHSSPDPPPTGEANGSDGEFFTYITTHTATEFASPLAIPAPTFGRYLFVPSRRHHPTAHERSQFYCFTFPSTYTYVMPDAHCPLCYQQRRHTNGRTDGRTRVFPHRVGFLVERK